MATKIERWQDGYVLLVQDHRLHWVKAAVFRTWELAWQYATKEFHGKILK